MKKLCVSCKEREIKIRKVQLCGRCYQRQRYVDMKIPSKNAHQNINHLSEVDFVRNFFEHKNWVYQPATFRFNSDIYMPDFYDGDRNVFIEVVGTRQAFSANKEKYKEFTKKYPKINFEIRQVNGDLIDLEVERQPQHTFSEK